MRLQAEQRNAVTKAAPKLNLWIGDFIVFRVREATPNDPKLSHRDREGARVSTTARGSGAGRAWAKGEARPVTEPVEVRADRKRHV